MIFNTIQQINQNNNIKIQSGSYVGDGTYGQLNPCSLTFDFAPKIVFIASNQSLSGSSSFPSYSKVTFIVDSGISGFPDYNYGSLIYLNTSNDGKTLSWYMGTGSYSYLKDPSRQMNTKNMTYYWVAIG